MPEKINIDIDYALSLPPEKAQEYFKQKGFVFTWDWEDMWQKSHNKAFTVAKVMKQDVLEDIHGMVNKAIDEGITFHQFKKELEPRLKVKGWWGKVDGVQLGSPHRLETIYRTNLDVAYSQGRYQEQEAVKEYRPYWMYVATLDGNTRPAHADLHGKVFPADDSFWDIHYPPNGWGCRCMVRNLRKEQVREKGLKIESSKGRISSETVKIGKKEVKQPLFDGKKTVSPDWAYNAGKEN